MQTDADALMVLRQQYITQALRQGRAPFTVSLPHISTSNSSETALKKELLRPYGAFLIGLTEAHHAKMSFSVC